MIRPHPTSTLFPYTTLFRSFWEESSVIEASFVSANWFSQIGHGPLFGRVFVPRIDGSADAPPRSEEHTSELQSRLHLVCRLLLEKKKHTCQLECIPELRPIR